MNPEILRQIMQQAWWYYNYYGRAHPFEESLHWAWCMYLGEVYF